MKRLTSFFLLLIITSTSIFAQNSATTTTAPADSLSYYLGATQGAMIKRQLTTMPMADSRFTEGLIQGLGAVLNADTSSVGYFEGIQMGLAMLTDLNKFKKLGATIDQQMIYNEIKKGLTTNNPLSPEQLNDANQKAASILTPLMEKAQKMEEALRAAQAQAYDSICEANIKAGNQYMDSLKNTSANIKFTDSGVYYKVIEKGKGSRPKPDQVVDVKYTGKTVTGRVFDSSGDEVRSFALNGVIKGFADGISQMRKGAHYIIYIPGELAYGPKGIPGKIEPMEMLIFDVELVDFRD